jgi:hypothetical protein
MTVTIGVSTFPEYLKGKREKYAILRIPNDALGQFIAEYRVACGDSI